MEHILSFFVVAFSQLMFFIIHAYSVGESDKISKYLKIGVLIGLPFGIIFDLIIGKTIGMFHYELGFVWWFLIINGIFSYGFMIANVLLLKGHSLPHMYFWSAGLGLTYEVVNWRFSVWEWDFASSFLEYLFVIFIAYAGLTWLIMLVLRVTKGVNFRLIPF